MINKTSDNNIMESKYIHSENLMMSIHYKDNKWEWMKIMVYDVYKSPYGYKKRDLLSSPFGLTSEHLLDVTDIKLYIQSAVNKAYSKFPEEEVDKFYNNIIIEL